MVVVIRPPYDTLIFDCDGVILDSNRIKTEAFRTATLDYGVAASEAMVAYHVAHGGISRFAKFEYFVSAILPALGISSHEGDVNRLVRAYGDAVADGLMSCAIAEGLSDLRSATQGARWLVVSGSAQAELRDVLTKRGVSKFFDGGIFGSPDTKDEILRREIDNGAICGKALFLGDSRYDIEAAKRAGVDVIFLSGWTEVEDWTGLVRREAVDHTENISSILNLLRLAN